MVFSAPSLSHQSSSLKNEFFNEIKHKFIKFTTIFLSDMSQPVALERGRNIWWVLPLTHLQDSDEKQRVDSLNVGRDSKTHEVFSTFCCVTKVVGTRKGVKTAVETHSSLDCKIWKDPVTRSKRARVSNKTINKSPYAGFLPRHIEMIKSEIVIIFQERNVHKVVKNDSYTQ